MLFSKKTDVKPANKTAGSFLFFMLIVVLIRSFVFSPFRIPSGSMIPTLRPGDFIVASKISYGWSSYSMVFGGYMKQYFNFFAGKFLEFSFPKRGDVIVFANPSDVTKDYIKRVVGIPGDRIQMIEGRLHINGTKIPLNLVKEKFSEFEAGELNTKGVGNLYEARIPVEEGKEKVYTIWKKDSFGKNIVDNTPEYTVPEDHVFCMGDNWDGSSDSRFMNGVGYVHKNYFLGPALFVFLSVDPEYIDLFKPWTWLNIPFKIRYSRCLFHKIS